MVGEEFRFRVLEVFTVRLSALVEKSGTAFCFGSMVDKWSPLFITLVGYHSLCLCCIRLQVCLGSLKDSQAIGELVDLLEESQFGGAAQSPLWVKKGDSIVRTSGCARRQKRSDGIHQ